MKPTIAATAISLLTATGSVADSTPNLPIMRIFEFVVAPENVDAFIAAGRENIVTSVREEPGVTSIYVSVDKNDPTRIYVVESYRDNTAYAAHRETEHFKAFLQAIDGKVISRRVIETNPMVLQGKPVQWLHE
ncbi:MAG: putative quinol monooxygenase [Paracoccus sp. (in: a-proteobacteria)]